MQRRHALAAPLLIGLPAWAHHGWSSFDQARPLYLEGNAARVAWRNPHVELQLEVAPDSLKLPPDLASRPLPAQAAPVDGPGLLRLAQLPARRDRLWQIELAPLSRMLAWGVPEIQNGTPLGLIGFTFSAEKGDPILRVEYLFLGGKAYGLRSAPA
jgi:hypothetical protein